MVMKIHPGSHVLSSDTLITQLATEEVKQRYLENSMMTQIRIANTIFMHLSIHLRTKQVLSTEENIRNNMI